MAEIEHTITITIRESLQPKAKEGFRLLRKQHQAAGGTSRLVKKDEAFTFTAKGPDIAVLDAIANVQKLKKALEQMHKSKVDGLRDIMRGAEARRKQNLEAVLSSVADKLLDKDK